MDWEVLPNSLVMLACGYHLLITSFYSPLSIDEVKLQYPSAIVLPVEYEHDTFYYVISSVMINSQN